VIARNLLLLVSHWPPVFSAPAHRAAKIAKYLPCHGWRPVVVTAKSPEESAFDASYAPDIEGIEVVRCPVLSPRRLLGNNRISRAFEIPDAHVGWIPTAFQACCRLTGRRRFSAAWTIVPPASLLAVGAFLQRRGVAWVCDLHDPLVGSPFYPGQNRFTRKALARWERLFLPRCDALTGGSDGLLSQARDRYGLEGTFIPSGYDEEDFANLALPREDRRWTIAHLGSLPAYRDPAPLVQALCMLVRRDEMPATDLRLRFVGYLSGGARRLLEEAGSRDLTGSVEIAPYRPYREFVHEVAGADLLIIVETRDDPHGGLILQLKSFAYLRASAPILAISPPNQMTRMIEDSGRGRAIWPPDPERIAEAVLEFYRARTPRPTSLPSPSENVSRYDVRHSAATLARVLDEAVAARQGSRPTP